MNLVEILLPLTDGKGKRFPRRYIDEVRKELTETFWGRDSVYSITGRGG